jgi:hypothetical protein
MGVTAGPVRIADRDCEIESTYSLGNNSGPEIGALGTGGAAKDQQRSGQVPRRHGGMVSREGAEFESSAWSSMRGVLSEIALPLLGLVVVLGAVLLFRAP